VSLVCVILFFANFMSSSLNFSTTNSSTMKSFSIPSSWSHPGETQHGNHLSSYHANNPPLYRIWSTPGVGTAVGVPIIDHLRNLVYCPTSSGLSTLSLQTGEIIWSTNYQERASSPLYSSQGGQGQGTLFLLVNCCLHSLEATTGLFQWKTCVPPGPGFMNSPVVSPFTGEVYFTVGTILYSVNPSDGTILWSHELAPGMSSSPSSKATLLYYPVMDDKSPPSLYLILSNTLQQDSVVIQFTPPLATDSGGRGRGGGGGGRRRRRKGRSNTGYITWSHLLTCQTSSALLWHDQVLYVVCGNTLYAYNPGSYYSRWEFLVDHSIGLSSPVARPSDGAILLTTTHATVMTISQSGILIWKLELESLTAAASSSAAAAAASSSSSSPSLHAENAFNTPLIDQNEKIFVTNALGKLYIISREGILLWIRLESSVLRVFTSPVIASTGGILLIESLSQSVGQVMNQYALTLIGNQTTEMTPTSNTSITKLLRRTRSV
jgi:outer membrane protein assembly factor BamB